MFPFLFLSDILKISFGAKITALNFNFNQDRKILTFMSAAASKDKTTLHFQSLLNFKSQTSRSDDLFSWWSWGRAKS